MVYDFCAKVISLGQKGHESGFKIQNLPLKAMA